MVNGSDECDERRTYVKNHVLVKLKEDHVPFSFVLLRLTRRALTM